MNGNRGNKKPEPKQEELEFIYERLDRLSDAEIINEMEEEGCFKLRTKGFFKRRRTELAAAKKALVKCEDSTSQNKHFERLSERAEKILDYLKIFYPYANNQTIDFELGERDDTKTAAMLDDYRSQCLLTHLQNEYSELKGLKYWRQLKIEQIDQWSLIKILGIKSDRAVFKGECDICKVFSQQIDEEE